MLGTVEVPVWLLAVIVAFAAVTFASHFLFPSVRWFLRRRMERAVARLNARLTRPIEPFKLARRHDTIQRLIYDPKVMEAVADHAREEGVPEAVAFEQARRYAREIVPSFSVLTYFGVGARVAKWLSRLTYNVRLGNFARADLEAIDKDATVIFVINHRSNMDYVLVTYLSSGSGALSYAAGEWARLWPLGTLVRLMGAYFIRRKSRDAFYRRVLARYVQIATEQGVNQAVFPEGGLSLDGHLAPPKLGILSYIAAGFDPAGPRDVVFVPVAVNYDRVLEDRVLTKAHLTGTRRFGVKPKVMIGFTAKMLWRAIRRKYYRFGYACVSFGKPVSLRDFHARCGEPERLAEALGEELIRRIGEEVPVLPVPLVATVLARATAPMDRDALQAACEAEVARLRKAGVHVHVPRGDPRYFVEVGLRNLLQRRIAEAGDTGISVREDDRPLLLFYANSIAHLGRKVAEVEALTAGSVAT